MSTIAYDGKTVAADLQGTAGGSPRLTHKLFKEPDGSIIGIVGDYNIGLAAIRWWRNGAKASLYPQEMKEKECTTTMIVFHLGAVLEFRALPIPEPVHVKMWAWGSGADYALGAMSCGKTAAEAVEIATKWDIHTGLGVVSFDIT